MVKATGDSGKMAVAALKQKVKRPVRSGPKCHRLAAGDESRSTQFRMRKVCLFVQRTIAVRSLNRSLDSNQPTLNIEKKGRNLSFDPSKSLGRIAISASLYCTAQCYRTMREMAYGQKKLSHPVKQA